MKKLLLVFAVFIGYSNLFAQSWTHKWNNSGDGWIAGWHIDVTDQYINYLASPGNTNNFLFVNPVNGWASLKAFDPPSSGQWFNSWGNGGNGRLNNSGSSGTVLQTAGKTYGIFNGSATSILYRNVSMNPNEVSFSFVTGGNWAHYLSPSSSLPNWNLNNSDIFTVGNFDGSNSAGQQELLCVCPGNGWATLHEILGGTWTPKWSTPGGGWIGSAWHIDNQDKYFKADVDGNGVDELICLSAAGYCSILSYDGTTWNSIWSNGGSGWIGTWHIDFYNDEILSGDFNRDGKDDILFVNRVNGWSSIKQFYSVTYWPDLWSNGGNGWINSWHIDTSDKYKLLTRNNRVNLFSISPYGWAMVQEFSIPSGPPTKDEFVQSGLQDNISLNNNTYVNSNDATLSENNQIVLSAQNYPNPFNPKTKINFTLPSNQKVTIEVYNQLGVRVQILTQTNFNKGRNSVEFDGSNLSSGIYFYKINTQTSGQIVQKMILVK